MKKDFTAVYQKEGKYILAWVEEIPGVNTQGKTLAEAKANLREALSLILETNHILAVAKGHKVRREPLHLAVSF